MFEDYFVRISICHVIINVIQGSKLINIPGPKFATRYENLFATLKILVPKLVEAIQLRNNRLIIE